MILTGKKLEEELENAYKELEIEERNIGSLNACLGMIKGRDNLTWEHCLRVGLKGKDVGDFINQDPKILFYSGLLHDVGKILTNPNSLKKSEDFNSKDMRELKKHPKEGYVLLKEIHSFSSEVLLRHHLFQENSYPEVLPHLPEEFSRATEVMINYFSRVLALVDFYDALVSRKNQKFVKGKQRFLTKRESRQIIIENNKDQEYFIEKLYKKRIF